MTRVKVKYYTNFQTVTLCTVVLVGQIDIKDLENVHVDGTDYVCKL